MPQYMQIFFGGSSSGKSYFIAQKIVLDNMDGANWLVCRNVAKTLRKSVFNEVKKAIVKAGFSKWYRINSTDMVITNKLNGKQILFAGLDDPEKVKSVTPVSSFCTTLSSSGAVTASKRPTNAIFNTGPFCSFLISIIGNPFQLSS